MPEFMRLRLSASLNPTLKSDSIILLNTRNIISTWTEKSDQKSTLRYFVKLSTPLDGIGDLIEVGRDAHRRLAKELKSRI